MKRRSAILLSRRTPGEVAFDRCFLPLGALTILWPPVAGLAARLSSTILVVLQPALGLVLAVLWLRAVATLIHAWCDPSALVVRMSALVLLIPFGAAALHFLRQFPWAALFG